MLSRMLGTKVAAATLTTVLLATGTAAATGSLPDAAQSLVSDAVGTVGIDVPDAEADEATKAEHDAAKAERESARNARKDAHAADLADQKAQKEADKVLDDVSGDDVTVDDEVNGAEHGIGKGSPTSQAGKDAHERRDDHLQDVADRQAGDPGDATEVEANHGTPASEQGVEAHTKRDTHLDLIADQKAERDALKDARPDDADESDDVADDDADDQDEDADESEDEDEGKGKGPKHESEDEAADPAV